MTGGGGRPWAGAAGCAVWAGVPWLGSNSTNLYRTEVPAAELRAAAATTLYICALGYGKVTVNGAAAAAGGLLAVSGWTNNERLNYYESYDLTGHAAQAEARGPGPRARSHCRFVQPFIHFIPGVC
jgi:hypothetical protein